MSAHDEWRIRQLTLADVPAALRLCRAAGWNQTHRDWQMLIQFQPRGCFAAVIEDLLVGTVTTSRFDDRLAWIGMMLVDEQVRRRGIARSLMSTALRYLQNSGVRCVKLEATPAGRLVYEKLGFQTEFDFCRWERDGRSTASGTGESPSASALDDLLCTLDQKAFGADRWRLLQAIATRSAVVSGPNGFGMLRSGHLADYLGPLIAATPTVARGLATSLLAHCSGSVFWDVPSENRAAVDLAQSLGFRQVRSLTRMWTGDELVGGAPDLQYALADPSIG